MLRNTRAARGCAAVGVAVLLLAGCSGGGGSEQDGELRIASPEPLDNWDPLQQANPAYMALVYDTLISRSADGTEFEPMLAEEWEQTNEYIEFRLRDDAVFHDGTPVDAEAIALNIERMRDTPHSYQASFSNVSDVVAVDETTVRLELSEPTAGIVETLADWTGSIVAPAAIEADSFQEPIGSAAWAYNAEESTPRSEVIVDAFDDYYAADEVGPSRIAYLEIADAEQRYSALQTGEADVIYGIGDQIERAESQGLDAVIYPKVQWSVGMTDIADTFSDRDVRRAVCHGIDAQQYLDSYYAGYGETDDQLFREGTPGYGPDIENYPYDVATARQLMADAGNPDVEFTIPTPDEYQPIYQVFASQMEEIGITVNLDVMPFGEFISQYASGDSPMILFSTAAANGPQAYYTDRFDPEGGQNPPGEEYPELERMITEAAAAPDEESANASWIDFSSTVLEEAYDCGHFYLTGIWISDPERVTNIVATPGRIDAFDYMDVEVGG